MELHVGAIYEVPNNQIYCIKRINTFTEHVLTTKVWRRLVHIAYQSLSNYL